MKTIACALMLAALPAVAAAAERPDWAFPPAGVTGAPRETETVPKTYFLGTRRMPLPEGGTEPIGMRVIEVPEDAERVELRDPKSGFIAYAPPGSLAKGLNLVATGGNGRTIACTICHGPT